MPGRWHSRIPRLPTCRIRPTWSTKRGGCRKPPGHAGPCAPGSGRWGNQ